MAAACGGGAPIGFAQYATRGYRPEMRILITGNMGYVGPALLRHLRARHPRAELIGFDSSFFAHCLTGVQRLPESTLDRQCFGDIRDFPGTLLDGVVAV